MPRSYHLLPQNVLTALSDEIAGLGRLAPLAPSPHDTRMVKHPAARTSPAIQSLDASSLTLPRCQTPANCADSVCTNSFEAPQDMVAWRFTLDGEASLLTKHYPNWTSSSVMIKVYEGYYSHINKQGVRQWSGPA